MSSSYFKLPNLTLLILIILSSNIVFANGKSIVACYDLTAESDSIYAFVDKNPEFPGGDAARIEFFKQNVQYAEAARKNHEEGRVIIQFVVNRIGEIKDAKILKGISESLNQEALRLVNSFPRWIPGELNGEKVSVYRVMPVSFKYIPEESDSLDGSFLDRPLVVIDSLKMPLDFNIDCLNQENIDTVIILKPGTIEYKRQLIDQYGLLAQKGVILIKTKNANTGVFPISNITSQDDANYVWKEVEKMPEFPGGEKKLYSFIRQIMRYPVNALNKGIQGQVVVRFIVDKRGKIANPTVIKTVDQNLADEAIRLVGELPDFKPGEKAGVKVNTYYTLPVIFNLEGESIFEVENKNSVIVLDGNKLPDGFNLDWLNFSRLSYFDNYYPANKSESKQLTEFYGKNAATGLTILVSKQNYDSPSGAIKRTLSYRLFGMLQKPPEFPGGEKAFFDFISTNLRYPYDAMRKRIQGKVILKFVVSKTGKVINPKVLVRACELLDQEALRVISLLPDFIPGENNGEKVAVHYTIPISFALR
ncbi:MAG: energy transducer TonB [Paludibacter sp.]|nr:energy transducer TonB [Paludibacter sp.]